MENIDASSDLEIPAGAFAATGATVAVTDPAAFPIAGLQMTVANAAGSVSGTPLGGVLPLSGVAKVCLFGPCASANTNVSVPLSVMGSGGSLTATGTNGLPVNVSVIGSPWTTGVAKIPVPPGIPVESPSQMTGFAHGPASATSSTFQPGGVVQLVTPMSLRTSLSTEVTLSTFATMTLRFVPEPGTLLLLGAGVAGLVAVSRTRRG